MTAAWSLSVSQLKEKLPEAVELLRCCAFFGPEPIPRDVFLPLVPSREDQPLAADPEHQLVIDPQLARLIDDPILLSTAIRELGRYALARIDSSSRTIQVHRLVQALVRDELTSEQQPRMQHIVHVLLANAAPKVPDLRPNWERYDNLLAHADPSGVVHCTNPVVPPLLSRRGALPVHLRRHQGGASLCRARHRGMGDASWRGSAQICPRGQAASRQHPSRTRRLPLCIRAEQGDTG